MRLTYMDSVVLPPRGAIRWLDPCGTVTNELGCYNNNTTTTVGTAVGRERIDWHLRVGWYIAPNAVE